MGKDKSSLPYSGTTLGQHVAEAVQCAAGSATFVGGTVSPESILDLYPGEGPLGGILTALRHATADWNLIVACDMPALTGDFLRTLVDAADSCTGDALVPLSPRGLEPLCAAYHRNALRGLYRAFERGERKIAMALEEIRVVTLPVPELAHFQNVNTPEEWAAYGR
jgi:molybdopterin-guanine dinucleotide biosynthesis protein A